MIISIIGFVGVFAQMMVRAVVLSPFGFYLSILLSVTSSLGSVGYRSHISKIVDVTEVGKVFTIIMVIGHIAPVIASTLLAKLFELTIDDMPGASFLVVAFIAYIPILIAIAIDLMDLNKHDNKIDLTDNK